MIFESNHQRLLSTVDLAFYQAVSDTVDEARTVADQYSKTGKFRDSIVGSRPTRAGEVRSAVIGSPLASARVKEKGGYIVPKRAKWLTLHFRDGSVRRVKAVRIRPTPVITKAGPTFIRHMRARLRERRLGGVL